MDWDEREIHWRMPRPYCASRRQAMGLPYGYSPQSRG
jgi:hypothetical protein